MYPVGYNRGGPDMTNIINEYTDEKGKSPYAQWLGNLRDTRAKAKIIMRVDKMELGLFGDVESVGEGLSELRIHYGPGYRVYYGQDGDRLIILLGGGSKKRQSQDIAQAIARWETYQEQKD